MSEGNTIVLPPDVMVVPVEDLESRLRAQLDCQPGEFAVTRPRARMNSTIVDARTAALLGHFRVPTTVVDAILRFSSAHRLNPRETLEQAYPILREFVNVGVLVSADSDLATPVEASYAPGEMLCGFEVLSPVQVLADTEVYCARAPDGALVAVKHARSPRDQGVRDMFAREVAVLGRLDGRVNPRLLQAGETGGRAVLVLSWCHGVDAYAVAEELRRPGQPDDTSDLLGLAERVIEAYAHLHAQGVVHGDVHPRNVLVDGRGGVTVIDYGLSQLVTRSTAGAAPSRGGIDLFMEPELAAARLAGRPLPDLGGAAEQYSVAALVYLLLTGAHTHNFSLEERPMLAQLAEEPPLPFRRHGGPASPSVEQAVLRALAKDPRDRFASVREFGSAFHAAQARDRRRATSRPAAGPRATAARRLWEEIIARLTITGPLLESGLTAPTASVTNGAAGLAYAMLRFATIREDERLLAAADLWSLEALRSTEPDAFWSAELGITREEIGEHSLYHTAPGVHCVAALVGDARGDAGMVLAGIEGFVRTARGRATQLDVVLGRSGLLLGCSLLAEVASRVPPVAAASLGALAHQLAGSIYDDLRREPSMVESRHITTPGIAHGWGGALYALLRSSEAFATELPPPVVDRLSELASLGLPGGRGLVWPRQSPAGYLSDAMAGSWCNGAAGLVHLWNQAYRCTEDAAYADLMELASWTAYEAPTPNSDLCCGLAGRAYALLAMYKRSGEPRWLRRARDLTHRAVAGRGAGATIPNSLYKSDIGLALLSAELSRPEQAAMPIFEPPA